jgi:putative transposase
MNTTVSVTTTRCQRQELFWEWTERQVRRQVTDLAEKVLEMELESHLKAGRNQRTTERRDYRNGYYGRRLTTPYGPVRIRVPRCRSRRFDASVIFDRYQRRIADVDRILRHTYLLGVSTRGTAQLAEQIFGHSMSHQTISQLMRWLDERLVEWRNTPIGNVYKVVYLDGMHVDIVGGDRVVMIVSGQRQAGGQLETLGFCVSKGERCVELLSDLRKRGLEDVSLFVSDESGAIRHALSQVYPEVSWQSCSFHKLKTLRDDIGATDFRDQMVAEAGNIFRCPSRLAAVESAIAWSKRWKSTSGWGVQRFMDRLSDSLTFYNLPSDWWKRARTNNPKERQIRTLRMRLNSMGCFHDVPAIERAVFGQLLRWHKIAITQYY